MKAICTAILALFSPLLAQDSGELVFRERFTTPESAARWLPVETPAVRVLKGEPPRFELDPDGKLTAIGVLSDNDDPGNYAVGYRWDYSRAAVRAVSAVEPGFPPAEGNDETWPWPDRDVLDLGRAALPALQDAILAHAIAGEQLNREAARIVLMLALPLLGRGERYGVNDAGLAALRAALEEPEWIDQAARNSTPEPGALLALRQARAKFAEGLAKALSELDGGWPSDVADAASWPEPTRQLIGEFGLAALPALQALACAEPAAAPKLAWMLNEIRRRVARDLVARFEREVVDLKRAPLELLALCACADEVAAELEVAEARHKQLGATDTAKAASLRRAIDALRAGLAGWAGKGALRKWKPGDELAQQAPEALGELIRLRDANWARAAKLAWLGALIRHRETSVERGWQPALGTNPENGGRLYDAQRGFDLRAAAVEYRPGGEVPIRLHPGSSYELTYRIKLRNFQWPLTHEQARRLAWQVAWVELVPLDARGRPVGLAEGSAPLVGEGKDRIAGQRHAATDGGWISGRLMLPAVPDGVAGVRLRLVVSNVAGAGEVLLDDIELRRLELALDEGFERGLANWRRVNDPSLGYSAFARADIEYSGAYEGAGCARLEPAGGDMALEMVRPFPLQGDRSYVLEMALQRVGAQARIELLCDELPPLRFEVTGKGDWHPWSLRLDGLLPEPRPASLRVRVVVLGNGDASAALRIDALRMREEPRVSVLPSDICTPGTHPALLLHGLPSGATRWSLAVADTRGTEIAKSAGELSGESARIAVPLPAESAGWFNLHLQLHEPDGTLRLSRDVPLIVLKDSGTAGVCLESPTAFRRLAGVRPEWAAVPLGAIPEGVRNVLLVLSPEGPRPAALQYSEPGMRPWLSELQHLVQTHRDRVPAYQLGAHRGAGWNLRGADAPGALDAAREMLQKEGAGWIELVIPVELAAAPDDILRAFRSRWASALDADTRVQTALSPGQVNALRRLANPAVLLNPHETLNLVVAPGMQDFDARVNALLPLVADFASPLGGDEASIRANAAALLNGEPYTFGTLGHRCIASLDAAEHVPARLADLRVRVFDHGVQRVLTARTGGLLLDEAGQPTPALAVWQHLARSLDGASALPLNPWPGADWQHRLLRTADGRALLVLLPGGAAMSAVIPVGHSARARDAFGDLTGEAADTEGNITIQLAAHGMPVFVEGLDEGLLKTLDSLTITPALRANLETQQLNVQMLNGFPGEASISAKPLPPRGMPVALKLAGTPYRAGEDTPGHPPVALQPEALAQVPLEMRPLPGLNTGDLSLPVQWTIRHGGRTYRLHRPLKTTVSGQWQITDIRVERADDRSELVIRMAYSGTEARRASVDVSVQGMEALWRRRMTQVQAGADTEVRFPWPAGANGAAGRQLRVAITESPGTGFAGAVRTLTESLDLADE